MIEPSPPTTYKQMWHIEPPSSMLTGFNLDPSEAVNLELLPGGCNTSYVHRASNTVFKPAHHLQQTEVLSKIMGQVASLSPNHHFQVPKPLIATTGKFVHEGWSATTFIPDVRGLDQESREYTTSRLETIIHASRAFHAALKTVNLTDLELDHLRHGVTHVWAQSHRMVWSGIADPQVLLTPFAPVPSKDKTHRYVVLVRRIIDLETALDKASTRNQHLHQTSSQLVHGDIVSGNNILFPVSTLSHPNQNPDSNPPPLTIIDFSPTFAPPSYAEGIILADAMIWCHLGVEVFSVAGEPTPERLDMVWRGVLFRCLSDVGLAEGGSQASLGHVREIERVVGELEGFMMKRKG